jgi:hypothetical protein
MTNLCSSWMTNSPGRSRRWTCSPRWRVHPPTRHTHDLHPGDRRTTDLPLQRRFISCYYWSLWMPVTTSDKWTISDSILYINTWLPIIIPAQTININDTQMLLMCNTDGAVLTMCSVPFCTLSTVMRGLLQSLTYSSSYNIQVVIGFCAMLYKLYLGLLQGRSAYHLFANFLQGQRHPTPIQKYQHRVHFMLSKNHEE